MTLTLSPVRRFCIPSVLTPSGRYLLAGSEDNKVVKWDIQSRQVVEAWPAHRDVVITVAHHPSQGILASGALEKVRSRFLVLLVSPSSFVSIAASQPPAPHLAVLDELYANGASFDRTRPSKSGSLPPEAGFSKGNRNLRRLRTVLCRRMTVHRMAVTRACRSIVSATLVVVLLSVLFLRACEK